MRSIAAVTPAFLLLLGLTTSACTSSVEAPTDTGEAPGPLVITDDAGALEVAAPAGEFNMFGIYAIYDTAECGLSQHVYGVTGPSGVRIEDCPECLLPGTVRVGEEIPGFELFACLPGVQECELTEDIAGLEFNDLVYETYLCGEVVMPESFVVAYEHLDTTEPEAPRTWITVSAEFRLTETGAGEVISDWERCVVDDDGYVCDGPSGSGEL